MRRMCEICDNNLKNYRQQKPAITPFYKNYSLHSDTLTSFFKIKNAKNLIEFSRLPKELSPSRFLGGFSFRMYHCTALARQPKIFALNPFAPGLRHLGANEQKTLREPKLCFPTVMSSKLGKIKVESLRFSRGVWQKLRIFVFVAFRQLFNSLYVHT